MRYLARMRKKIGEVLVEKKLVSQAQIEEILKEQAHSQKLIGELLVEKQLLSEILLYQALAHQHRMPFVDLQAVKLNEKLIQAVPYEIASEYSMIPIEMKDHVVVVAVANPRTSLPVEELKVLTGAREIQTVLSLPGQIEDTLRDRYSA